MKNTGSWAKIISSFPILPISLPPLPFSLSTSLTLICLSQRSRTIHLRPTTPKAQFKIQNSYKHFPCLVIYHSKAWPSLPNNRHFFSFFSNYCHSKNTSTILNQISSVGTDFSHVNVTPTHHKNSQCLLNRAFIRRKVLWEWKMFSTAHPSMTEADKLLKLK